MNKPKAISGREFGDNLPYMGEYYQPDDRVCTKQQMDKYINYLEEKIKKYENITNR